MCLPLCGTTLTQEPTSPETKHPRYPDAPAAGRTGPPFTHIQEMGMTMTDTNGPQMFPIESWRWSCSNVFIYAPLKTWKLQIFYPVAEGPMRPCCIISLLRITNYSQSSSHKSFRIQNILSKSQKCFKTWHITKFYLGSFEIEDMKWNLMLSKEVCSMFMCFSRPPSCEDEKLHWLQSLSFSPLWGLGLFSLPLAAPLLPSLEPPPHLQFHPFFHSAVDVGHH